jgi:hypothetical protein
LPPDLRAGVEVLEVEVRWRDPAMLRHVLNEFLQRSGDGRDGRAAGG